MSKNKHTGFVFQGQVNELAYNVVNEMVREVNVCCQVFFHVIEEHREMKIALKCAAILLCVSC